MNFVSKYIFRNPEKFKKVHIFHLQGVVDSTMYPFILLQDLQDLQSTKEIRSSEIQGDCFGYKLVGRKRQPSTHHISAFLTDQEAALDSDLYVRRGLCLGCRILHF